MRKLKRNLPKNVKQNLRRKANQQKSPRKPKVELNAVDFAELTEGSKVRVKVGEYAKNATVVEVLKDSARIQLENGLVMNVTADRLFA